MSYSASTNRLSTIGSQSVQYDAAGNMLQDGTGTGSHAYTWDGEGRMASVSSAPGTTVATYVYNALGQRVERTGSGVPNGGTLDEYEVYPERSRRDAFGNRALIMNNSTNVEDYIPAVAGRNFVKYTRGHTYFMHTNPIGSTGTLTDEAGNWTGGEIYDPWGQRWATYGSNYDERYASMMMRDAESGLDPTDFRMYTSQYGRWLSPDPLAGHITNPQSLNRYAYVMNNPTTRTDPLGLDPCKPNPGNNNCKGTQHPPTCLGMVCADQYYGGSLFEGFGSNMIATICTINGVTKYCSQGAMQFMSPTGADEFDVGTAGSGVYWTAPPGSASTDAGGRTSTSTGSLGFSDALWGEANGTSDELEGTLFSRSQSNSMNKLQALYDAVTGDYVFGPATPSADTQGPSAGAFGPVFPTTWEPLPGGLPGELWILVTVTGPAQLVPVPGLSR